MDKRIIALAVAIIVMIAIGALIYFQIKTIKEARPSQPTNITTGISVEEIGLIGDKITLDGKEYDVSCTTDADCIAVPAEVRGIPGAICVNKKSGGIPVIGISCYCDENKICAPKL